MRPSRHCDGEVTVPLGQLGGVTRGHSPRWVRYLTRTGGTFRAFAHLGELQFRNGAVMTLNDAFERQSDGNTQLMQKSLFVLALTASLIVAFRRHDGMLLAVVLTLAAIVVPAGLALAKHLRAKSQHRETEARMMIHTRAYLQNVAPVRMPAQEAKVESDIEILARAIDGRKLPQQDFRKVDVALHLPAGEPVVFDALPRRYAIGNLYQRRFADLAAALPGPVTLPLSKSLPPRQA